MKQGLTNTKRIGFVSRADLNIGKGGVGANMRSQSLRTPMNRVGVAPASHPKIVQAGMTHWETMMPSGQAVSNKIVGAVDKGMAAYNAYTGATAAKAMGAAVQSHPAGAGFRVQTAEGYGPSPLEPGFTPTFAPGADSMDRNRPPSPQESRDREPIVMPEALQRLAPVAQRFAESRTGRFLEGRLERKVDRFAGAGAYGDMTGRGRNRKPVQGPPPPF
jgi:hypothetical protein